MSSDRLKEVSIRNLWKPYRDFQDSFLFVTLKIIPNDIMFGVAHVTFYCTDEKTFKMI